MRLPGRGVARGAGLTMLVLPAVLAGQETDFQVRRGDRIEASAPFTDERGYAVVSGEIFERLGWTTESRPDGLVASFEGHSFTLEAASPYFRWNGDLLQLVSRPYRDDGVLWVPVQLLLDFLPAHIPTRYAAAGPRALSIVEEAVIESGQREAPPTATDTQTGADPARTEEPSEVESVEDPPEAGRDPPPAADPTWGLVVIDPGHGGRDPGASGPGGRREKDIALSIGRALARELSGYEGLEVRMTRDRDQFVPLWERGHLATELKRDRPAIFLSIHVNSLPSSPSVRGFETYFLSEARTEHEARVAENENAPLALQDDAASDGAEPGLDFILRELRNRDHQRWSSVLAEEVQRGIESIHPGPNRGVKQGPFAVITNALMPAVLIEAGFLTNPREERLLSRSEFQRDLARVIAQAVGRFFERYPGAGGSAGRDR